MTSPRSYNTSKLVEASMERFESRMPSSWEVRAGLRAATVLEESGSTWPDIQASLELVPTDGLFRLYDLLDGLRALAWLGMLIEREGMWCRTARLDELLGVPQDDVVAALFAGWLASSPPLWLHTAVGPDDVMYELIPTGEAKLIEEYCPDPVTREMILLAAADKVNASENAELGAEGETFVVELCRDHLKVRGLLDEARRVRQVSRISDALGYDVTSPWSSHAVDCRMEVKTTRASGEGITFFLSRNEAQVARRDPQWVLVACRKAGDSMTLVGWCDYLSLQPLFPADPMPVAGARSRWASVRISLPGTWLRPGLPIAAEPPLNDSLGAH